MSYHRRKKMTLASKTTTQKNFAIDVDKVLAGKASVRMTMKTCSPVVLEGLGDSLTRYWKKGVTIKFDINKCVRVGLGWSWFIKQSVCSSVATANQQGAIC